jgi:hypothetical protein
MGLSRYRRLRAWEPASIFSTLIGGAGVLLLVALEKM